MRDIHKALREQEKTLENYKEEENKITIDSDDDESNKLLKTMRKQTTLNL